MPISTIIERDMKEGASWIRKMFEQAAKLKREGKNVYDLSLGNPQVPPPKAFHAALQELVNAPRENMHRYMHNAGYPETRAAIAQLMNRASSVRVTESDIVMSCGVAGGLNVVFHSLFNPGDEIIIFAPYFPEYRYYIEHHQLTCRVVETNESFLPDLEALRAQINLRTRAVLINTPNNPTGVVYDEQAITAMSDLLTEKGNEYGVPILLLHDDAYHNLVYEDVVSPCVFNFTPRSIVVASFSKTLSIPGERIGYIAVHPELEDHQKIMDAFSFCTRTLGFVNAPALMQHVIRSLTTSIVDLKAYQQKRDYLFSRLVEMGYEVTKPYGAFYIFPRTPSDDDIGFVEALVKENVLAVPGTGFGRKGYMRLSYSVSDEVLEGAVRGLKKAFQAWRR